jgi:hypothetical protein
MHGAKEKQWPVFYLAPKGDFCFLICAYLAPFFLTIESVHPYG